MITKENAHLFLPLIQALIDGKTLQAKTLFPPQEWVDIIPIRFNFSRFAECYRVKPNPKWYRVAEFRLERGVLLSVAYHVQTEIEWSKTKGFVRWLSDRVEYE